MKTFSQFMSESGGSPGQPYVPPPGPSKPTQPEEGFDEFRKKYGLPPKNPVKLAKAIKEDSGTGNYNTYVRERNRRKYNIPNPQQISKERKLTYMLNQDRPGRF